MTIGDRLLAGMGSRPDPPLLAEIDVPRAAKAAPVPNHSRRTVCSRGPARDGAGSGRRSLARRAPRRRPRRPARDRARSRRAPLHRHLPRQLVHGDFWNNNVWFQGDDIVLILDLDFMGERAASTISRSPSTTRTRRSVRTTTTRDALRCSASWSTATTAGSRATLCGGTRALPYALARTVLVFVGMLASIDDAAVRRALVREIVPDLQWSFDLVRRRRPLAGRLRSALARAARIEELRAGGVAEPLLVLLGRPAALADEQQPHVGVVERPEDVGRARSTSRPGRSAPFSCSVSTIARWLS